MALHSVQNVISETKMALHSVQNVISETKIVFALSSWHIFMMENAYILGL